MLIHAALAAAVSMTALNAQAQTALAQGADRIAAAFGNTVVSVYPDGRTQRIWLHPNGDWDGIARNGKHLAGHWSVKGQKVCMRQSSPPTLPFSYCAPFPEGAQVGSSWAAKDFVGTPIHLIVLRGLDEADQRVLAQGAGVNNTR